MSDPRLKIHSSHKIVEEQTIISTANSDRYGTRWRCAECGGEAWQTVGGSNVDVELTRPCGYSPADEIAALRARVAELEASRARLAAQMALVVTRLGICRDRFEGCDGNHELSLSELPGWIDEARSALIEADLA